MNERMLYNRDEWINVVECMYYSRNVWINIYVCEWEPIELNEMNEWMSL